MDLRVQKALNNIDDTYQDLIVVAEDIFQQTTKDIDEIMMSAYNDIEKLSNDAIRDLMLRLSLKSYTFSEIKEKAAFKSVLAETIRKEEYAQNFNKTEGTVAVRENTATIDTGAEILSEEIYTLVANMLKTKLDEVHRVVNTLQTVLMTRRQEAKLTSVDIQ
jgi:type IV secretory pathway VirB4 component